MPPMVGGAAPKDPAMNRFATLKTVVRLATLGLVASSLCLAALPAQAAPPHQFKPIPGLQGQGGGLKPGGLKPIPGMQGPQTIKPIKPIPGLQPPIKPIKPIPGLPPIKPIKPIKPTPGVSGGGILHFDPGLWVSIGESCLTNKQIRRGLAQVGFEDIDFVKELKGHRVRVEALYQDGWVYSLRVDRCDRSVDQIKPLYED
jgi:hypothetical protein